MQESLKKMANPQPSRGNEFKRALQSFKYKNPKAVGAAQTTSKIVGILVIVGVLLYAMDKLTKSIQKGLIDQKITKVNSLLLEYSNDTESYQEIYASIRNLASTIQHSVLCIYIKKNRNMFSEMIKNMIDTFVTEDCKSPNVLKSAWTSLRNESQFQNAAKELGKQNKLDNTQIESIINEVQVALYRLIDALYAIACYPTQSDKTKNEILFELSETIIDSFCITT